MNIHNAYPIPIGTKQINVSIIYIKENNIKNKVQVHQAFELISIKINLNS